MRVDRIASAISLVLLFAYLWLGASWPLLTLALDRLLRVFSGPRHSSTGWLADRFSAESRPRHAAGLGSAEARFSNFVALMSVVGAGVLDSLFARPVAAAALVALLAVKELIHAALGRDIAARARLHPVCRRWFVPLANHTILNRIDQWLTGFIGAPFRSRRSRVRLTLAVSSVLFALLLVFLGVKLHARSLGIRTHVWFVGDGMFRPDVDIGFVNQPNLSRFNYLNVWEETNDRGFKHPRPVSQRKPEGAVRIVGFGDSVMWGMGVSRDDAFMGLLDSSLGGEPRHEVINAGTIHYSSLQELLFFEKYLVPLAPDIVTLNLCSNDIFPTDDPFNNVRSIYVRYLKTLRETASASFSEVEMQSIEALIDLFGAATVWKNYRDLTPRIQDHAVKFLVELPYRKLIETAAHRKIRLIVLLIPAAVKHPDFENYRDRLIPLFQQTGTEYIDFTESLTTDGQPQFSRRFDRPAFKLPVDWPDLRTIQLFRQYEWKHENQLFVDESHPTRLGNQIIARRIHEYLAQQPAAPIPR
jgi:lysophospholipase L1-like esterase